MSAVANVQLGASSSPATAILASSNTMTSSPTTLTLAAQPASTAQLSPSQIILRRSVSLEALSVIEEHEPRPQVVEPPPAPAPSNSPSAQSSPSANPPTNQSTAPANAADGQSQPVPPATDTPDSQSAPQGERRPRLLITRQCGPYRGFTSRMSMLGLIRRMLPS